MQNHQLKRFDGDCNFLCRLNYRSRIVVHLLDAMVEDIAVGSGGLRFDSLADQIGHNVANGSPLLRRFFETLLPRR